MGGDFNENRFVWERKGIVVVDRLMSEISDFVDKYSFVDLPMIRNDFTWSRGDVNLSVSWIARLLISLEWKKLYPKSSLCAIPKFILAHFHIFFIMKRVKGWPTPFRFE